MLDVHSLGPEDIGKKVEVLMQPKNGKPFTEEGVFENGGARHAGVLQSYAVNAATDNGKTPARFVYRFEGIDVTHSVDMSWYYVGYRTASRREH